MKRDLTTGSISRSMLLFAVPMILGNLLQQLYNIADTFIVGQYIGADALGAVGTSYTLMVFLTSVILGLCMGSGAVFSMLFGAGDREQLRSSIVASFVLIGAVAVVIQAAALLLLDPILHLLRIPAELYSLTREYMGCVFWGIFFTFLYNYFASYLRAVGNSTLPLIFLVISTLLNIGLDVLFVLGFSWGVWGAAFATIIAQGVSALLMTGYCLVRLPIFHLRASDLHFDGACASRIFQYSFITCIQQSIMNLGILMIQGLVNSFGPAVMSAFAAAVKIDSFAYMPVQDFGNAFSTFIAQNFGARQEERIQKGIRFAVCAALSFCAVITAGIWLFADKLMLLFVQPHETEIIAIGVNYLHIEGTFYFGIGCLFLLYGLYRAVGSPKMSVVLTVISLGTRVLLAYCLAPIPAIGLAGIWWAIPIGWILADLTGFLYYRLHYKNKLHTRIQAGI